MSDITWTFAVSGVASVSFVEQVQDDYQLRFNGGYQYTKDLVLGATTSAQNYIDFGAFDVDPMRKRCEFTTSANRETFHGLQGQVGTLSSSNGLSYTAALMRATRIEGAIYPRADAVWEAR
jgi:hypothetical protein